MKKYTFDGLLNAGISLTDAQELRRISMTLHRWYELECGDGNEYASWSLVRGSKVAGGFEYEDAGRPYIEFHGLRAIKPTYRLIADRERGALRRLDRIMAQYSELNAYVQSDPRGCALYVGKGLNDSNYSNGIAVYK